MKITKEHIRKAVAWLHVIGAVAMIIGIIIGVMGLEFFITMIVCVALAAFAIAWVGLINWAFGKS